MSESMHDAAPTLDVEGFIEAIEEEERQLTNEVITDGGFARRLYHWEGHRIRWHKEPEQWLVWDEKVWRPDKTAAHRIAQEVVAETVRRAAKEKDAEYRKRRVRAALAGESAARQRAILAEASANQYLHVRTAELDANPMIFAAKNGVIDLTTGELVPFVRSNPEMITKQSPVYFDSNAKAPRWEAFLASVFRTNSDVIPYLQRLVGYALTGDTGEQVFWIFYGDGSNGKNTLTDTLHDLFGDYVTQTRIDTLTRSRYDAGGSAANPQLVALQGARLVTAPESSRVATLDTRLVKELTGERAISARQLYKEPITFPVTFKLLISTNHKPRIDEDSFAIWRRTKLVGFHETFPLDRKFPATLREELPGILAWAVRGCLEWQKSGLLHPPSVEADTAAYRAEQNVVSQWLEERRDADADQDFPTATSVLYSDFLDWCRAGGEQPVDKASFGKALGRLGLSPARTESMRGWYVRLGFKLADAA